mgnify:CR=1 FL=1
MKIFTKFIYLSIVAISLLTGCDINSKCNCLIENNVGYFRDVSLSDHSYKDKIIRTSQELQELVSSQNEKDIINKYDDDFFSENALVAVSLLLDASYYDCEVTSFKLKNKKIEVTVKIKDSPGCMAFVSEMVNWLILIEVSQEEVKDCTDVEVTIAEPSC